MNINSFLNDAANLPTNAVEKLRLELQCRKEFEISFAIEFNLQQKVVENMAEAAYNFSNTVLGPKKIKKNPFNLYTKEMKNKRKLDRENYRLEEIIDSYNSMGPLEKDRYYKMAKEDSATLHQESSVSDVKRGAKSILTIMDTMKLSMNYNSLFLFWESDASSSQKIGRLLSGDTSSIFFKCIEEDGALKSFLEAMGNVERRPMREIQPATIAANDFRNKMNKRLISLFNEETGETRKSFPWKAIKNKKGTIRAVGWPEKVPFVPLSLMKDIEKEMLVDALDKGLISFSRSLNVTLCHHHHLVTCIKHLIEWPHKSCHKLLVIMHKQLKTDESASQDKSAMENNYLTILFEY
ncbi:hypothetical protein F4703DRAFT_1793544 [Phycomyces blakesleeanus]